VFGMSVDNVDGAHPALVAIDWGTSALRGWLLSADGTVLDRRTTAQGIMALAAAGFDAAYRAFTDDWRAIVPALPALASGMIGSRQGWIEAPYVECPAGFADLVDRCAVTGAADARLAIVPGLSWRACDGMIDVMRGEEMQVFGALAEGAHDGLFILPGTHSKWVRVDAGRIVAFATSMTGELFAILRGHSILGRMMPADGSMTHVAGAFDAGVADGLTYGHDLPRRLFGVRTRGLFGDLDERAAPSFLSGLLIGAEIRVARMAGAVGAGATAATLIGDPALCRRYAQALGLAGVAVRIADAEVTPRGLWRLARAAGMIAA
jgi:2-dehydro-3-deoxygalactonokinase